MGLIQASSTTNPLAANYQPGRQLTSAEISARQNAGAAPMSSYTNPNAANYGGGIGQSNTPPAVTGPGPGYNYNSEGTKVAADANQFNANGPQYGWGLSFANNDEYNKYRGQLDAAYDSGIKNIDDYISQLNSGIAGDTQGIEDRYVANIADVDNINKQNVADQSLSKQTSDRTIQNALQQAISAYNVMNQKAASRFGLGSGAGQAFAELASREFFKNQGNISGKQADTSQLYANNMTKIQDFATKQISDLRVQKEDALTQLKKQLNDTLYQLNQQKTGLNVNKGQAQLQVLQSFQQQAQNIYNSEMQMKSQLASTVINGMQQTLGRALTMPEISSALGSFGINFGGGANLNAQAQTTGGSALGSASKYDDYLKTLGLT